MGYFAELDHYNARAEFEAWLDEQEQEFLACFWSIQKQICTAPIVFEIA